MKLAIFVLSVLAFPLSKSDEDVEINVCDSSNTNNSFIYCHGRILEAVNYFGYYDDAKTFVDMPLKHSPNRTLEDFNKLFNASLLVKDFDNATLNEFIESHFLPPGSELYRCTSPDWKPNPSKLNHIRDPKYKEWALHIHKIWGKLCKKINETVEEHAERYSLIYVPHQFIAPGGRFREFYYWDTYWIIRGLLISEMYETAQNMIRNLGTMVDRYGFVPNGGRVYYLQRSQPPLLIPMVYEFVAAHRNSSEFLKEMLPLLERELNFWKSNRTVNVTDSSGTEHQLFQYNTRSNVPRPEMYRHDVEESLVKGMNQSEKRNLWRDIASCCESGWDFSSRWFGDKQTMRTVKTRRIVPVDLNAFLCWNMDILQFLLEKNGSFEKAAEIRAERDKFRLSFLSVFYNETERAWFDWDLDKSGHNTDFYASAAVPLFTGSYQLLNNFRSFDLYDYLQRSGVLAYPGGIPASAKNSGQQWDFPNGWPNINHMVIEGLRKSHNPIMQEAAFDIADRWIRGNYKVYKQYGHMYEKYDVKEFTLDRYGEYDVQVGFGWTNGVVLDLLYSYGDRLVAPDEDGPTGPPDNLRTSSTNAFTIIVIVVLAVVAVVALLLAFVWYRKTKAQSSDIRMTSLF